MKFEKYLIIRRKPNDEPEIFCGFYFAGNAVRWVRWDTISGDIAPVMYASRVMAETVMAGEDAFKGAEIITLQGEI